MTFSSWATTCPFSTTSPSRTSTAWRIPPSRLETDCVRREPTTDPSAWVTSSMGAQAAQTSSATTSKATATDRARAVNAGLRDRAASTSLA